MMADDVFLYPGGKRHFPSWILDQVPEHHRFVEVFGGAAGVSVNKDPDTSKVGVYNDRDGDFVRFFEVLRDRSEGLAPQLDRTPYSRELHDQWAHKFLHGNRPSGPVKRAEAFYLRNTQWDGKYGGPPGFGASKVLSRALSCANKVDRLDEFSERFGDVVIENLDWAMSSRTTTAKTPCSTAIRRTSATRTTISLT